jgi:hypothetical protein
MSSLLALTDAELDTVFAAAHPLDPDLRDAFFQAVADALSSVEERGPGMVYRACREQQARFLTPPEVPRVQARWQRRTPRFERQTRRAG